MSSRLLLAIPRFLWRGKWFWGAWLLLFLLPQTRDEARLHFLGSRFVPRLYGQPWQEYWAGDEDKGAVRGMTPIERAVWREQRENSYNFFQSYSYGNNSDPASNTAGRLLRQFPRETWLRALALRSSLGYGSIAPRSSGGKSGSPLVAWARKGHKIEPRNAFYPLVLAKAMGDLGRRAERETFLQHAAACAFFDDGSTALKRVAFSAARKTGISTWSEQNDLYTRTSGSDYGSSMVMDDLAAQLAIMSQRDRAKNRVASLLSRSRAMMRVALLLQSAPCETAQWRQGESWARSAWSIALSTPRPRVRSWGTRAPANADRADFEPLARRHGDAEGIALARQCAARIQLLSSASGTQTQLGSAGGVLVIPHSPWEFFWSQAAHPCGFGLLFFGFYLFGWWWLASIFNWRAVGRESSSLARALPAIGVVALSLAGFFALYGWFYNLTDVPLTTRFTPPIGQMEVLGAAAGLMFFAPPLLLALWCAIRTRVANRALLRMPARQQVEMRLSSLEGWLLSNATGTFFAAFLLLSIGFAGVWAFLRWQNLSGYDWLRAIAPHVSTRVVPKEFTSLESPAFPIYSALCSFPLLFVWLAAWRFVVGNERRAVFHSGIRAWKEALGCALTATVWVYFALMLGCHFSGEHFKARLQIAATRGEGALIPGFQTPPK